MRFLLTILGVNFILTAPLWLLVAAAYGSEDDQWIAVRMFWVSLPFTIALWVIIIGIVRKVHDTRRIRQGV